MQNKITLFSDTVLVRSPSAPTVPEGLAFLQNIWDRRFGLRNMSLSPILVEMHSASNSY